MTYNSDRCTPGICLVDASPACSTDTCFVGSGFNDRQSFWALRIWVFLPLHSSLQRSQTLLQIRRCVAIVCLPATYCLRWLYWETKSFKNLCRFTTSSVHVLSRPSSLPKMRTQDLSTWLWAIPQHRCFFHRFPFWRRVSLLDSEMWTKAIL